MPLPAPRKRYRLSLGENALELGSRTLIMGVLNVTPDSFSDGGRHLEPSAAVEQAWRIAEDGADILDVGGESTRPGSVGVSVREELDRVLPVLEALAGRYPIPISIDTSKPEVAAASLERGASMINDVTGLAKGPHIAEEAARSGAALVLMHMRGEPRTMQTAEPSRDIMADILAWASAAVARARAHGVSCDHIILDPGIGFGKTARQNLEIIGKLECLASAGFPLLVGTSRKSFIGTILDRPPEERIWGTAATVAAAILSGAHIVRVHDVKPMRDVARMTDALLEERPAG